MSLSNQTLTLLVLIALGLGVLGVLFSMFGGGGRRDMTETPPADEVVGALLARIERIEKAVRTLHGTDKRQQLQIEAGVRRVGLLRYDAFEDVGGRLSFSAPLRYTFS